MPKINRPAWSGLRPGIIEFLNEVPSGLSYAVMDVISAKYLPGIERRSMIRSMRPVSLKSPFGHYRIRARASGNAMDIYLRVSKPMPDAEKALLHKIRAFIYRESPDSPVPVDTRISGKPVRMEFSRFRDLSALPATKEDLSRAGRAVGNLHKLMRSAPFSAGIKAACSRRSRFLERARRNAIKKRFHLFSGRMPSGYKDFTKRFEKEYRTDFMIAPGLGRQAIHGDLNAGNLLKADRKGILIVDFEDAAHSYFPRLVDIAFFAERSIFYDMAEVPVLKQRLAAFFRGYLSEDKTPFSRGKLCAAGQLLGMMKQINYYAFCVLAAAVAAAEDDGYPVKSELRKFIMLEKRASDLMPLAEELDAAIPQKRKV